MHILKQRIMRISRCNGAQEGGRFKAASSAQVSWRTTGSHNFSDYIPEILYTLFRRVVDVLVFDRVEKPGNVTHEVMSRKILGRHVDKRSVVSRQERCGVMRVEQDEVSRADFWPLCGRRGILIAGDRKAAEMICVDSNSSAISQQGCRLRRY